MSLALVHIGVVVGLQEVMPLRLIISYAYFL